VDDNILTRRLRVVKYRGSTHGTNEYPFVIEADGISVMPVTSIDLKHTASTDRVSTGIPGLDAMFGGKGYFRGSSILVSGTAGTGKTTIAAHFVDAACRRGERCMYFSFEESPSQVIRNMTSVGLDLQKWNDKGLLHFCSARPSTFGLEMHLVRIHKLVTEIEPGIVVVDPVTGLLHSGAPPDTRSTLLRLVDFLKSKTITALMTTLIHPSESEEQTEVNVSSLVDSWLMLRDIESGGERNRGIYILKARGLAHSNQIREFRLTDHGVELREVYLGEGGLLTGSARVMQEAKDATAALQARREIERKQFVLQRKRRVLDSQIAALQLELEAEELESQHLIEEEEQKLRKSQQDRTEIAKSRRVRAHMEPDGGSRSNGGRK
jgi:circadian clock protein KaiC